MIDDPQRRPLVVLVDDMTANLRVLTEMLGSRGFDVRPVTSGEEALGLITMQPPDLVLLDVNMPGLNGYEVCSKLRQTPSFDDIPVIFLTALTDIDAKVRGFAVGGNDYVTKPFQIEEIVVRVNNQIALRRARVALAESLEQLRMLERVRDDLVHMVVHDMRSPLTVLLSRLDLLQTPDNPDDVKGLVAAKRAAHTLMRLANMLLDVSRLESGEMPIDRALHDLAGIADEVIQEFSVTAPDRRISLSREGNTTSSCDGMLIRRVLENLIGNALKHTPKGSDIRVAVVGRPDVVRVSVSDAGRGVLPELRERIFDKYVTGASTGRDGQHSSGLGLAFCKLAVTAQSGRIDVESATSGGSTFWFELPAQVPFAHAIDKGCPSP